MTINQQRADNILTSIRDFNIHIKKRYEKVEALKLSTLPSAIRYDKDKIQSSPQNYQEKALADAVDLEYEIEEEIASMDELKINVYNVINSLEDEEEQKLLLFYYYDVLSWQDVAAKMHRSESSIYDLRLIALENFGVRWS